MSMLWIICGAGRGVGKTTLALRLCEVLPDSIYAKYGCGKAKPGKSGNFFNNLADLECFIEAKSRSNRHMIIESNRLAILCRGDMTIFIDGIPGKTRFRKDTEQLRSAADIKICRDITLTDWKKALAAKVDCRSLGRAVCDCLLAQSCWLFGSAPVVRSKVWFESAGTHIFGCGLAHLLENINRCGTLHGSAGAAGMSYRYAWNLIRTAEEHFGKTLIERRVGGVNGGGSILSADGRHMLRVFKQLNKEVAVFADRRFPELYKEDKAGAAI